MTKTSPVSIADDLSAESLLYAVNKSINYYKKLGNDKIFYFGSKAVTRNELLKSHQLFAQALAKYGLTQNFYDFIENNFDYYTSESAKVLVTGYFEASLNGSRTRSSKYKYPLYRKPNDLISVKISDFFPDKPELPDTVRGRLAGDIVFKYYDREDIDYKNKLSNKNLEIVWVDDLLDSFFLHIQGSGIVYLDDGNKVRVNYASQNGHPYKAIGKYLVDNNYLKLEDASMQSIRKVLSDNPELQRKVLSWNPSYVFFREVNEGPVGSIGQVLTPLRSVALDKDIFPRGSIGILKTKEPVVGRNNEISWKEVSRFVVNQDTGGAITGAGRVDYFMGHGEEAAQKAGVMKQAGNIFFILKK
ncbi:MAG: MltA domain-containing protein [Bdellovibrionota bacterium]